MWKEGTPNNRASVLKLSLRGAGQSAHNLYRVAGPAEPVVVAKQLKVLAAHAPQAVFGFRD